ncbi:MAG: hypothetical protein ACD_48C00628G0001 [uncultured bacterium]|uniref:FCP1 homology domain-containing protein n=1 Tax=Candidatus Roizmanbacteria bacterium RIFOXYA1_FULL_41_12 TaxID=1802082 RepID=A0A1F7K5N3_9BACT|nr:MAG: hypothetical protein ACD_48C00628G0001 [uncultured bacterium]OGK63181.1 MAG: hypothetical protein A2209_02925 [Candidatus Roizmanbacteria bacterium RIFOXYA1_FULL_41_12]
MITTLLFDLGEVVLTNDWTFVCPQKDKEFSDYYGITNFSYVNNPFLTDLFTGKMTERDFWINALGYFKAKTTDPTKAIALARKYSKEKPGMIELLQKLKTGGYTLGIISNTHTELLDWKVTAFHLKEYFTYIISSCGIGIRKPDQGIYLKALETINVEPEQCIFIDDKEENIIPAIALGMKGIVFTNCDALIIALNAYGITV